MRLVPKDQLLPTLGGTSVATLAESFGPWATAVYQQPPPAATSDATTPAQILLPHPSAAGTQNLVHLAGGGGSTSSQGHQNQRQQQHSVSGFGVSPMRSPHHSVSGADAMTPESGSLTGRWGGALTGEREGDETADTASSSFTVTGYPPSPGCAAAAGDGSLGVASGSTRPRHLGANGGVFATVPTEEALKLLNRSVFIV